MTDNRKATPMTDTTPETFEVNPMIELTGEQLARVAALVNAGELIRGGGIMRGDPAHVNDIVDLAEYIIHGHTIVRTSGGKKGVDWYSRIDVDGPVSMEVASTITNRIDTAEVAQ